MNPTFLQVTLLSIVFVTKFSFAEIQLDSCSLSCSEHQNGILLRRELIGPPGKAGIQGSRGFRGLKGQKGGPGSPGAPCACRQYDALSARLEAIEIDVKLLSNGWVKADDNLWYKLFESKSDYATAKAKCESMNARLASKGFRSTSVRRKIGEILDGHSAWIGLTDIQAEGRWMWIDGLQYTGRSLWNAGEPNNSNGNEDCAYVFRQGNNLKLNDAPCTVSAKAFCEKSA